VLAAGHPVQARFNRSRLRLARRPVRVADADVGAGVGEYLLLMDRPGRQVPAHRPEAIHQPVQHRPGRVTGQLDPLAQQPGVEDAAAVPLHLIRL
jgi:hypothetical protein